MVAHVPGSGCCEDAKPGALGAAGRPLEVTAAVRCPVHCPAPGDGYPPCPPPPVLDDEDKAIADAVAEQIASKIMERIGGRVMPATLPPAVCEELAAWRPMGQASLPCGSGGFLMLLGAHGDGQLYGELRDVTNLLVWSGVWGPAGG